MNLFSRNNEEVLVMLYFFNTLFYSLIFSQQLITKIHKKFACSNYNKSLNFFE